MPVEGGEYIQREGMYSVSAEGRVRTGLTVPERVADVMQLV